MTNQVTPRLFYSIEEIALNMAGINSLEYKTVKEAVENLVINAQLAEEWRVVIKQHLLAKTLLLDPFFYKTKLDLCETENEKQELIESYNANRKVTKELLSLKNFKERDPKRYLEVEQEFINDVFNPETCSGTVILAI